MADKVKFYSRSTRLNSKGEIIHPEKAGSGPIAGIRIRSIFNPIQLFNDVATLGGMQKSQTAGIPSSHNDKRVIVKSHNRNLNKGGRTRIPKHSRKPKKR